MPIVLVVVGVVLVGLADVLQPNTYRKPRLLFYLNSLGGIIWLVGVIWAFFSYELLHAVLLLIGSFIVGALLRPKPKKIDKNT